MPKVDLTATKDFTYMTRRLTAGDPFQARNPLEARILTRVRKVAQIPVSASDGSTIREDIAAADKLLRTEQKKAPTKRAPAKLKAKAKK